MHSVDNFGLFQLFPLKSKILHCLYHTGCKGSILDRRIIYHTISKAPWLHDTVCCWPHGQHRKIQLSLEIGTKNENTKNGPFKNIYIYHEEKIICYHLIKAKNSNRRVFGSHWKKSLKVCSFYAISLPFLTSIAKMHTTRGGSLLWRLKHFWCAYNQDNKGK